MSRRTDRTSINISFFWRDQLKSKREELESLAFSRLGLGGCLEFVLKTFWQERGWLPKPEEREEE